MRHRACERDESVAINCADCRLNNQRALPSRQVIPRREQVRANIDDYFGLPAYVTRPRRRKRAHLLPPPLAYEMKNVHDRTRYSLFCAVRRSPVLTHVFNLEFYQANIASVTSVRLSPQGIERASHTDILTKATLFVALARFIGRGNTPR